MAKPIIGVIGSKHLIEDRIVAQRVGQRNLSAVSGVADALPLIFAATPDITDVVSLLEVVDGILLTGGRANVHPSHFNVDPGPSYEPYDEDRDKIALNLVRACVAKGIPILGICRGIQEMAVAFGSTLHPEISELPGRINHRAPRLENGDIDPDPKVVFAERHDIHLISGGVFAKLFGQDTIRVNSLHGQGILDPGKRVVVEGLAEDGTIEAIRIANASAFALGVQWHAEHNPKLNPINGALFRAFGRAIREYKIRMEH